MSVPEKIEFAGQVFKSMDGNPEFPDALPTTATLETDKKNLETAQDEANVARQVSQQKTLIMEEKESTLDNTLRKLGNYVENKTDGDEAKILSSGFLVRAKASPTSVTPQVLSLNLTTGDGEGELDASWNSVSAAKSYVVEVCEDPLTPTGWKPAKPATKSSATITGLTSGKKYWVRVAAVTAAGQGTFSDPATKYAP